MELKRQYQALIGKPVEAPEVTGREVSKWVKGCYRFGTVQGEIWGVSILTGSKKDSIFVVIEFIA
eukprot:CAMPEP_0172642924 /NCGR_PEP_ID=MMETSP1068-20121228/234400_1 /TAXON_ID=35684 /ORGANISM="Pseudopedinella elastica, Strain CCMP716" /LENGTH=64 /DNA_ID=CAMNT_0013456849 /DNA_START=144 /DNA_END=334 /DNA_ORIENTATION=+